MHRRFYPQCVIGGILLLGAAGSVTATGTDLAQVMPADTLLYVGWSQLSAPDSAEMRLAKQAAQALGRLAANEPDARAAMPLLEAAQALQTGSVGLGVLGLSADAEKVDLQVALVVECASDHAQLAGAVRALAGLMEGQAIEAREVAGERFESVGIPDTPLRLLWGTHKNRFLATIGEAAAAKMIACLDGKKPTLADSAEFKFDRGKLGVKADGKHFCAYADITAAVATAKQVAEHVFGGLPAELDPILARLGVTAMRSKYVHADRVDDRPRLQGFLHTDGPRQGLLSLWEQQPVSDDDLKLVPKDAYWMQVNNLDLARLWQEAMQVTGAIAPDAPAVVAGALAASKQFLGFSITDDLLPAFGDTWVLLDAPDHGGILLTGTVLIADARQPDALAGMISRGIEMLAAVVGQGGEATAKECKLERGGHTIHYLMLGGLPSPVAPAWSFVGDRIVIGLYPQTVATALRQVDPKTRGPSILDHPDFQTARQRMPKELLGVGYYDSRYFARLFYPFKNAIQTMGMSMLGRYGLELDLDALPPLPEDVAHVTNSVGASSRDPDGITYLWIGDGVPVAAGVAGAALATSVALPSLARARELAKRAVCMANLKGIGQGCFIYANDHGDRFPDELGELIRESIAVPKMFVCPSSGLTESHVTAVLAGGPGRLSYTYIARQTTSGDVRNVLIYEDLANHNGEGASVLFLDGHVEFLKPPAYQQAVRDTYVRLKRESEIPPGFAP